jgi:hypothetical protein
MASRGMTRKCVQHVQAGQHQRDGPVDRDVGGFPWSDGPVHQLRFLFLTPATICSHLNTRFKNESGQASARTAPHAVWVGL